MDANIGVKVRARDGREDMGLRSERLFREDHLRMLTSDDVDSSGALSSAAYELLDIVFPSSVDLVAPSNVRIQSVHLFHIDANTSHVRWVRQN